MEEQPQPLEKETAEINGSKTHRLRVVIVFLFLLTVFLVSVYTFILQRNYSENTLESAVEWNTQCADAIQKYFYDCGYAVRTLSEAAKGAERAAKAESHPLSLYSEDGGGRQTDLSD